MIKPSDLLDEARQLAQTINSGEVRRRTIISRAYYAAYHKAQDSAKNLGYLYDPNAGAGIHEHLIWFFKRYPDSNFQYAGRLLSTLRTRRTEADYWLRNAPSPTDAREAIEEAEHLMDEVL